MTILIIGLSLFFLLHLFPSFVNTRAALIQKIGAGPYKGIYSLIAALGLGLIIYGKSIAPFEAVYEPIANAKTFAGPLVLIGFYLFIGRRMGSNIKRYTAHPMLWGIVFWAAAHLLANGDLASVLLFGAFLAFSLLNMALANQRGAKLAQIHASVKKELLIIGISIAVFGALLWAHGYLFGVNLLA